MNLLILGMGTGEIIFLIVLLIVFIFIYKIGKNVGEKTVYKEILNKTEYNKSTEIMRLEKLVKDKIITQSEFEILRDKIK